MPFFSIHPLRRARQSLRDLRTGIGDGPFGALRHPDFRRFIAGQGISLIGTWMQTIAQGWLVLDLTHSAFAVGLATTLATLPVLLFTLYGGVVADRVDRRKFVMFLQGVMMTEAGVMAGLALTHHITMPWIYGLVLVFGFATAFEVPTRQAFLVELVPREDLISAAALNSTNYNLARVIGPAIAGVIIAVAGVGAAFALNAVSYVAVLIAFARIKGPARPTGPAASPSILTGVRFIAARADLAALTWLMVLLTIFVVSFVPMLPVYAREELHTGARGYGLLTSAVGAGAALGAIVVGAIGPRLVRGRIAVISAATMSLAIVALGLVRSMPLALLLLAIAGAAMAGQGISTATSLQLAATTEVRGRVMAVYSFVVLGLAPIGAFQAGFVAEHLGTPWSFAINGTVCLLGALWLRRPLWEKRED